MQENFITRVNIFVGFFFFFALAFMMFGTFFRHITPDISVFLLHTRTFIEKGNRFIDSFDNKGPIMTFFLLPAVWLLGANIKAAALTQLVLYSLSIVFVVLALKDIYGVISTLIVAMLYATFCYSGWLWGGNFRPEDFMPLVFAILLFVNKKYSACRIAYLMNGLCISLTFLLKLSLIVAPFTVSIIVVIIECLKEKKPAILLKGICWTLAGFLLLTMPVLCYLYLFDDIYGWMRQTLLLPFESRVGSPTSFKLRNFFELILQTGVIYLLIGAAILFIMVFFIKLKPNIAIPKNVPVLLLFWIGSELLRTFAEGSVWPYLLSGIVPASFLSISLISHFVPMQFRKLAIWVLPLIAIAPLLSDAYATEIRAFKLRVLEKKKAPYEELASRMQATYLTNETMFVEDTDYQIFLLLGAPPPYPILKRLFWFVRDNEREAFLEFYAKNPPDWIIAKKPETSPVMFEVEGDVDFPYHIWHYGGICTNGSAKLLIREGTELSAEFITKFVRSHAKYKLSYDIGWAQAWRKQE